MVAHSLKDESAFENAYVNKYSHLTKKERETNIVNIRSTKKIQRNELCICGSGKKYKHCCEIKK